MAKAKVQKETTKAAASDALRTMVDQYDGLQRQRIAASNRADAIRSGKDKGDAAMYESLSERMKDLEGEIASGFKAEVKDHPMGGWLLAVRGIGPTMAAKVIGFIGDIERFSTASKLWRYAGLGVVPRCNECNAWIDEIATDTGSYFPDVCQSCGSTDHRMVAERMIRGRKAHFDPRFKTMLHNLAEGLIRANSPYRQIYDDAYEYYMNNRPEWAVCQDCELPVPQCKDPEKHGKPSYRSIRGKGWSTGRVHLAARRKMVKIFLSHVFEAWRRIERLPLPELYVFAVLGHTDRLEPEQFVDYDLPPAKRVPKDEV